MTVPAEYIIRDYEIKITKMSNANLIIAGVASSIWILGLMFFGSLFFFTGTLVMLTFLFVMVGSRRKNDEFVRKYKNKIREINATKSLPTNNTP